MNYIVDANGLWYEGTSVNLRLMPQHPTVLPIGFAGDNLDIHRMFLEDYFNSATRIRRGRLYEKELDNERNCWWSGKISHFPYDEKQRDAFGVTASYKTAVSLVRPGLTVVLGDNGAQSHWVVVMSEKTGDACYLTLKSKTYFGVLPEVSHEAIPEANRADILQALDAVVEAAPIQAPQPVIDACRNAACYMISAKFPESNPAGEKDLGPMVHWLNGNELRTKADAADIVNSLHSRAKANASAQHGTRPVSQQNANLAVDAIAFLLQDFGWAEAT